jgi:AraC family transcriptional regulator, regulatory protein of adaptative response / methylated-DNA-[protein]-cysteine methyltransferase
MTALKALEHSTVDPDHAWEAVVRHDRRYDGRFVYAVRTTGVYCRPSCASRRPNRRNVRFFADPTAAEAGGFRACRRCRPRAVAAEDADLRAVRLASRTLDARLDAPPTLAELGSEVGLSPWHLQRVFKRVVGVSPREWVEARRMERLKSGLREGQTVSRAVYGAGYGSGRPVYERTRSPLGMTPATYRRGGRGLAIRYAVVPSPLGRLLVAATERGVCSVRLGETDSELEAGLHAEFPEARLSADPEGLGAWAHEIVRHLEGETPRVDVPVDVRATAFQWRVWNALRTIPPGQTRSYAEVAQAVGAPRGARAVAQACAANPVALVVPCHRVVRGDGDLGGYKWGSRRKVVLLEQERRRAERAESEVLRALVGSAPPGRAALPALPAGAPRVGQVIAGRYELRRHVGSGGMGLVYEARDRVLDESVALKLLRADLSFGDEGLGPVAAEVRLTRRVTHPNVVRTHDVGEAGNLRFLVMEYVAGISLADLLARRPRLPAAAVVVLGMQLCRALEVVHTRGVLHRDVKPQNILLTADGQLKLTDFGVAALRDAAGSTVSGYTTPGTPAYMAPELLFGEAADARSDVFAAGVVLHQALTGRVPFDAPTITELAARMLRGGPPPITSDGSVPARLAELVAAALAAEPAERPVSAAAFHDALAEVGAP